MRFCYTVFGSRPRYHSSAVISSARTVQARIASATDCTKPLFSNDASAASVVPPGDDTSRMSVSIGLPERRTISTAPSTVCRIKGCAISAEIPCAAAPSSIALIKR